jgi:hypothetical protein
MRRYEAQQAALQRRATEDQTGDQTEAQTATPPDRTPNETAVGRDPVVM